jgi:6-pyruvoyltetrahydropterin/6-carboxytetrahydropterin synthase
MTVQRYFDARTRSGEIGVTRTKAFEAAHAYRGEGFGRDRRVHGHNYVLTATIGGRIDRSSHMLVDFRELDRVLAAAVTPLDHRQLDLEYAPIAGCEPGTETLVVALFRDLSQRLASEIPVARLVAARLAETDALWAEYAGGADVDLTRAYEFSAAHRLADPARSDEENRATYGKCANPHPHGHDYRLEVTVTGAPDPATGLVADLGELDRTVSERVLSAFDHRYLNLEVAPFDRVVPTAERIAERVWDLIAGDLPGLDRVVIYETPRSAFTYRGSGR